MPFCIVAIDIMQKDALILIIGGMVSILGLRAY